MRDIAYKLQSKQTLHRNFFPFPATSCLQAGRGGEGSCDDTPPPDWSAQTLLLRELPWGSLAGGSAADVEGKVVVSLTEHADTLSRASGEQRTPEWLEAVTTAVEVCSWFARRRSVRQNWIFVLVPVSEPTAQHAFGCTGFGSCLGSG